MIGYTPRETDEDGELLTTLLPVVFIDYLYSDRAAKSKSWHRHLSRAIQMHWYSLYRGREDAQSGSGYARDLRLVHWFCRSERVYVRCYSARRKTYRRRERK